MKCPVCGQQLRPGKKDPNYLLCYNCKKKYKAPQSDTSKQESKPSKKSSSKQESKGSKSSTTQQKAKKTKKRDEEEEGTRYSNLPPKKVRDKREEEMRRAYDEMLAVGDGKSKKKKANTKKRQKDYDDDYYEDEYDDYYEDDKVSKAPIIILGIAILVVAAAIAYLLLFR